VSKPHKFQSETVAEQILIYCEYCGILAFDTASQMEGYQEKDKTGCPNSPTGQPNIKELEKRIHALLEAETELRGVALDKFAATLTTLATTPQ